MVSLASVIFASYLKCLHSTEDDSSLPSTAHNPAIFTPNRCLKPIHGRLSGGQRRGEHRVRLIGMAAGWFHLPGSAPLELPEAAVSRTFQPFSRGVAAARWPHELEIDEGIARGTGCHRSAMNMAKRYASPGGGCDGEM
jgi:hypothetical protein